jgi:hypothetical protein
MPSPIASSRQKWLLLAVGLLIGFGVGRYAAEASASRADHPADGSNPGARTSGTHAFEAADERTGTKARGGKGESREFGESVRSIFRETIKERRVAQFENMLTRVDVSQFETLVSLIRENDLRGNDTGEEWTRLWQAWGQRDPAGAFDFMQRQDWTGWDPAALGEARNRALISWSQTDPEQARHHVESDEAYTQGDRSMIMPLVGGWAEVDPEGAVAWLAKTGVGRSGEYGTVVEAISRRRGAEGLDAWFSEEIRQSASDQDRNGFAQAIAQLKQEYEPEKAAAWVQQHLGEEWLPESEILDSTASAFASRNPEEAMTWAAKTGIASASVSAMNTWCHQDLAAASDWMVRHANDSNHAASIPVVASFLIREDPASAKAWIGTLPESEIRQRLLLELEK